MEKLLRKKVAIHKNLAYSFIYMARANDICGTAGIANQYRQYAREHIRDAKRLVAQIKKES